MMKTKLPESETKVKISKCGKCNGVVRIAVAHMMTKQSKKDFAQEVMEYNLSVSEQPLLEYKKENQKKWCFCE